MSSSNFYGLEQLWKYCKIIECGENGELVFLADNLNMFLSKIGGNYDTNLPIAAISVVGPPKTGKSVFANLVVKYLKENGNVTWMNDLEDGTRLTGFEYGHGLNTVTYDCLSPDSNSSGIYIYPEFFENPDSPNIKFLILVLHIHIIGRVSWKGEHDAIHLLLSLLCSHIIEIQRVKGVNQACPYQNVAPYLPFTKMYLSKFILTHIFFLGFETRWSPKCLEISTCLFNYISRWQRYV